MRVVPSSSCFFFFLSFLLYIIWLVSGTWKHVLMKARYFGLFDSWLPKMLNLIRYWRAGWWRDLACRRPGVNIIVLLGWMGGEAGRKGAVRM